MRWLLALVVVAMLTVACEPTHSRYEPVAPDVAVEDVYEVSAHDVVDTMETVNPGSTALFCDTVDILGTALGYDSFAEGFGSGQNPSAREVFNELLSRC